MNEVIRVDYDVLKQVADRFGQQSEAIAQIQQRLRAALDPLQNGGWIGLGSTAFFAEMGSDIMPAGERLADALREAQLVTNQIIGMMQQAEEEAASGFQGHGGQGGLGMGGLQDFSSLLDSLGFGAAAGLGGDLAGGGAGALGDDYGIPHDWLAGVIDNNLNDYTTENYNDYGIPQDWLSDVAVGSGDTGSGAAAGFGTSGSGGGAGGGTPGGGAGATSAPAGGTGGGTGGGSTGGGSGSTSPQMNVRDPFGRGNFPREFGASPGTAAPAAASGGLRYQSLGSASVLGAAGSTPAASAAPPAPAAAAAAPATASAASNKAGLSVGIAAASPFVALLGKAIIGDSNDD